MGGGQPDETHGDRMDAGLRATISGARAPAHPCAGQCVWWAEASNPRCVTRADAPCRQRALRTESDSDSGFGFGFGFQSCAAPGGRQLTVMGGFPTSIPGRGFARSLG